MSNNMDNKNDLNDLRVSIEEIDHEMARLFEKRMSVSKLIAEYKFNNNLPIFDREREEKLIEQNSKKLLNPELNSYYKPFLQNLMDISKEYQYSLRNDKNIIRVSAQSKCYDVIVHRNIINRINSYINTNRKTLIITDDGIPSHYIDIINSQCKESFIYILKQGESSKNIDNFCEIQKVLISNNFNKNDCIISLGGGVVSDLSAFVASTYMRGIEYYSIPTTLLSQVDASVGGKTAIDFQGIKNTIGTFYQPTCVLIDPELLNTLPKRHFSNGIAEIIKVGLLFDRGILNILGSKLTNDAIDELIIRCVKIKSMIVSKDECDSGIRKLLNFGHTIGHAIESYACGELLHGECVALGMLCVSNIKTHETIKNLYIKYDLPLNYYVDINKLKSIIVHDKKTFNKYISLIKLLDFEKYDVENIEINEFTNCLENLLQPII